MLLPVRPRRGREWRPQLLLLLGAAVLLGPAPVSGFFPAAKKCPSLLQCTTEGRQHCRHGSSHCGPCLSLLVENAEGRCVARKRHLQPEKVTFFPDTDEEIDFLQSVIAKQQVTEIHRPKSLADVPSQTDTKKNKTDASSHTQQSPDPGPLHSTTAGPLPHTTAPQAGPSAAPRRFGPEVAPAPKNDNVIIIVISLCVVVGAVAVFMSTACFIKSQRESRLAQKVDYPAFGGAGVPAAPASTTSMGDKTLAQSAQMYHYQHRKQQMLSVGSHAPDQNVPESEATSDEEEVGGDFTVYECPGLAPTGEMEVKNPLFDDSTLHYQGNHK